MQNITFNTLKWIKISLINFCVVALAGILLRYKINFSLPFVDQKFLLHAHSHFAFTGWITLILMTLMVNYLQQKKIDTNFKKYHYLLGANLIVAYGMFFAFMAQGYELYSITFSTLSIFISYGFAFTFWRDINKVIDESFKRWFKTGLVLLVVSSIGAFTLAGLMAMQIKVQDYYFAAVYFFLHFQYNGWFLFVCFGLLFSYLSKKELAVSSTINKRIFWIMAITVAPTYFLSILWLKLPLVLHVLADISGILQLAVLIYFIKLLPLLKNNLSFYLTPSAKYLWLLAYAAFILKVILQLLSIVPFLSTYAFAFRPIVIGYLHLSFLGIISFFILGYISEILSDFRSYMPKTGVLIFITGVIIQEIVLMCQGLEVFGFRSLPYGNIILFYSAIIIGSGLVWVTVKVYQRS